MGPSCLHPYNRITQTRPFDTEGACSSYATGKAAGRQGMHAQRQLQQGGQGCCRPHVRCPRMATSHTARVGCAVVQASLWTRSKG